MKREKITLYALDALCALLFSMAAGLVLFDWLGWEVSAVQILLTALVLLALYATASLRVWLPAAILAAVFGLPAAVLLFFGQYEKLAAFIMAFDPEQPVYRLAAVFLLLLPTVLLFLLLCHKLLSPWTATLVSGALVIFTVLWGQEALAPFLLLAAGTVILLPAGRIKSPGRLRAQGIALLFTLPVLLLSLCVAPKSDGEWYSTGLRHVVGDVQDYWEYHYGTIDLFPTTSMRGMGWMPLGGRLGGDIEADETVVFIVNSEKPFLLRGEVLVDYTGTKWQDAPGGNQGNFRLGSLLFGNERQEAFGLRMPVASPVTAMGLYVDVDARITARMKFQSLFLPYRTQKVEPGPSLDGDVYFDLQGETWLSIPPESGYSYDVVGQTWYSANPYFDQNMHQLCLYVPSAQDEYYAGIAETCLQVPDTVPGWVGELCEAITADEYLPYEKACALRDYLKETCTYTLTPGEPDPDEDFVAQFLTDRQGYCTYYASALTVMCRLAGIPARYVTGYGMYYDYGMQRCVATHSTAHAWTEIYLSHIGWVPVDALTTQIFRVREDEHVAKKPAPVASPTPRPSATPDPEELLTEEEITGPPMIRSLKNLLWLLLLIPLGAFVAFGEGFYRRRYAVDSVLARTPDRAAAAEYYYKALLRQLRLYRLEPGGGETLRAFLLRAQENLPTVPRTDLTGIARVMNRLRYGGFVPEEKELREMGETVLSVEKYLRKAMGLWRYFFRAFLFGK